MADHPAIVFRDGVGGRRAVLAAHRLDVWQVIEPVRHEGSTAAAAEYLRIRPGLIDAAVGYYAGYPRRDR